AYEQRPASAALRMGVIEEHFFRSNDAAWPLRRPFSFPYHVVISTSAIAANGLPWREFLKSI
ncbi:hypothetical protein P3533_22340, partial [Vibrio parahaemolyticus]|nr:hypothetical protein [Vibrio parahaemolyticus]MDG2810055.1 hypothetical protein [Vibrio parahaemolyticus]